MPSSSEPDPEFFDRADAHIHLANQHGETVGHGRVSASFLFAASRYNAFIVASRSSSADEMRSSREDAVDFFVKEYRRMLEENLDDYIDNFVPRENEA